MIPTLLGWLSEPLYIKVGLNQITAMRVSDGKEIVSGTSKVFANSRLAIADFVVAAKVMRYVVRQLRRGMLRGLSPDVLIHQTVMNEGGLSPVERRTLRELALQAGARKVYVWEGEELSLCELRRMDMKNITLE